MACETPTNWTIARAALLGKRCVRLDARFLHLLGQGLLQPSLAAPTGLPISPQTDLGWIWMIVTTMSPPDDCDLDKMAIPQLFASALARELSTATALPVSTMVMRILGKAGVKLQEQAQQHDNHQPLALAITLSITRC